MYVMLQLVNVVYVNLDSLETSAKVNKNAYKNSLANILKKKIAECQCQNSLDGNVCDVTTGQCGLCKPGFFGDFCDKGKQKCLWKFTILQFKSKSR